MNRITLCRVNYLAMLLAGGLLVGSSALAMDIQLASSYSDANFHTKNLQLFASDVSTATAGKVLIKVSPNGTLLAPGKIFAGVREGKAQAGEVIMSSLSVQHPVFGMDALPFIVSSYGEALRMWDASRVVVEKTLAGQGLQLLYAVPWPPQNLYAAKPLTSAMNFKGARMRVYNPATKRIAELSGAVPATIESVNLEKAIAAQSLDLMITSSATGVDTKAWTGLGYYYRVNAWIPKNVVFMNAAAFNQLDGESRKQLLAAARAAEVRGWKMSEDSNTEAESQLAKNNIKIAPIDPYMRIYLDRMGEGLTREWLHQADKEESLILLKYVTERPVR